MLITIRWWTIFTLLMIFSAPALADIRASYTRVDNDFHKLIVEVSDEGTIRVSRDSGELSDYFLFLEGETYQVTAGPGGPNVITLEAAAELARRNRQNVYTVGEASEGSEETGPMQYVPIEAATIAGHDGIRYNYQDAWDPISTQIVLSDDPALLPLGKALNVYEQATSRTSVFTNAQTDNVAELLSEHGVLAIWRYELTSVSFDPIDRARFVIPATALTLADLETAAPEAEPATSPEANIRQPFVIGAEYLHHTLYTLLSDGRLQAWPEGAEAGRDVDVPAPAFDFCAIGDDFFLVAVDPEDGNVHLWTRTSDIWSLATAPTINRSDPFVALDCSTAKPVMITNRMLGISNYRSSTDGEAALIYGWAGSHTYLQHGGFLYQGINVGEWGGGLHRYPLDGGAGKTISQVDPDELCGGILNPECHPVTGLVADPQNPDCIFATIGLVHFFSQGAVIRVCGDSISLAYEKHYTLDPDWQFDPENSDSDYSSVAFYSLGGNGDRVWAVASDGIYEFGTDTTPEFTPFPRVFRMPESGIDWSHPEFVLVQTTMNQRFSVSGASLILVPR